MNVYDFQRPSSTATFFLTPYAPVGSVPQKTTGKTLSLPYPAIFGMPDQPATIEQKIVVMPRTARYERPETGLAGLGAPASSDSMSKQRVNAVKGGWDQFVEIVKGLGPTGQVIVGLVGIALFIRLTGK